MKHCKLSTDKFSGFVHGQFRLDANSFSGYLQQALNEVGIIEAAKEFFRRKENATLGEETAQFGPMQGTLQPLTINRV